MCLKGFAHKKGDRHTYCFIINKPQANSLVVTNFKEKNSVFILAYIFMNFTILNRTDNGVGHDMLAK